jgi:hypothetical protein
MLWSSESKHATKVSEHPWTIPKLSSSEHSKTFRTFRNYRNVPKVSLLISECRIKNHVSSGTFYEQSTTALYLCYCRPPPPQVSIFLMNSWTYSGPDSGWLPGQDRLFLGQVYGGWCVSIYTRLANINVPGTISEGAKHKERGRRIRTTYITLSGLPQGCLRAQQVPLSRHCGEKKGVMFLEICWNEKVAPRVCYKSPWQHPISEKSNMVKGPYY